MNPNTAQIPCSFLPPTISQCITHSFDKFQQHFENNLPENPCLFGRDNENSFGFAVCSLFEGVFCIGEQY
jgi:hypothetical protein